MPHDEWAECPNCGKTVWGRSEIEAEFGYRFGGTTPQSWCRSCRARERNEKNCGYTLCPWHGEPNCSSRYDCPCNDD